MRPSLSVVIPAYNEEKRLPGNLKRIAAYLAEGGFPRAEVLVVNDGSSDQTAVNASRLAGELSRPNLSIRVLNNPGNRGKGYSVRHGMQEAAGDWVLFSDADLSAPIEECDKLLRAVNGDSYQGAIGSRGLDRSLIGVHQPFFREMMGRIFNLFVRTIAGLPYADTQCGFKLFSKYAAKAIFSKQSLDRFGFDVEILYLAKKLRLPVAEVPVVWNDCEGTKVRLFGGVDAFLDILRVRWNDLRGKYR